MMLMLGNFRFSVNQATYQSKSRTTSYRWAKQDRLFTEPALQFIGPGSDSMTLQGVILPQYKGGLQQVEYMRQEARKGNSLLLVEGSGKVLGYWVIESIAETQSIFLNNGAPKHIEFVLELRKDESSKVNRANDLLIRNLA